MKINALQDLKKVRQKLAEAHALAQAQAAAQALAARQREAESNLFVRAVGAVQRLPVHDQVNLDGPSPAPIAHQRQRDNEAVLRDCLSDEFDASTLLDTDDALSFRRPSVGTEVTRKLRKGEWAIQREIDLHGLRSDEARTAVGEFLRSSVKHDIRCVRIIHGKGLGSIGKEPVLKEKVKRWLVQKDEVLAFCQAPPRDGGAGALLVILKARQ